ncbi:MAG TPA: alpha/beta hydrolase [Rhodobacteraceae bacterium]|jgi:pimeloyl-ACP methyl ester carboxylesterase|nr:alpha/beta hydrolase [Paracoccaceae bacterium]
MAEPLLLIPSMMSDARVFSPQITEFSTERAVHIAAVTNCETISEMAASVLKSAPENFALAGHGMGAVVAMDLLRTAPDRVSRIALISTNLQSETPADAAAREPQIVKVMGGRLEDVLKDVIKPECLAAGPIQAKVLALVQAMGAHLGEGEFVRQTRAMQRRPDHQKTLRKIKIPALVLCGAQDSLTPPRRHQFMSEMIPYGSLCIIDDAGHFPTLESPKATNDALRKWLDAPLVLR